MGKRDLPTIIASELAVGTAGEMLIVEAGVPKRINKADLPSTGPGGGDLEYATESTPGKVTKASTAEVLAGSNDDKYVTPADDKAALDAYVPAAIAASVPFRYIPPSGDTSGATDQAAIQAALTSFASNGGTVQLAPGGTYYVENLILGQSTLLTGGEGHAGGATRLISVATSGPVITINQRCGKVEHLRIDSTAGRRAASTTTGHGILISSGDIPTPPSMSRFRIFDVDIRNQPTDGLHTIGSCELSRFEQISVYDCVRHGFVHDGGTISGYTNLQRPPFIVKWIDCRAFECGGQALIVQSSGGFAPFRLTFDHFEALGCAWDSTKRYTGVSGAEMYQCIVGGRGVSWLQPDIEDQQYAQTATALGNPRDALTAPAMGIYSNTFGAFVMQPYFSSLSKSWMQQSGVPGLAMWWPDIALGTYGVAQTVAIDIGSSACLDVEIHYLTATTSGATAVVNNRSRNARIVADGIPMIGEASTAFDIADGFVPTAVTIATGTLTTTNRRTIVGGQGAAADDLATIRFASGINGYAGLDIYLFVGDEEITVKHGTGNIKTISGADVVMTPAGANTVLHFMYDGTNWIQV